MIDLIEQLDLRHALQKRLDMERDSLPNQLAVIGYLKHESIDRYVSRNYPEMYVAIQDAVLRDARQETIRDLNVDAMCMCMDFLIYSSDWGTE
jgi:hypothetical protein